MHRLLPAVLVLLLFSCSLTDKKEDARQTSPQPRVPAEKGPAEPVGEPAIPLDEPTAGPPLPLPQVPQEASWGSIEEPVRSWEESEKSQRPQMDDRHRPMLETLTSGYGVRLPSSASLLNLESAVGTAPNTYRFKRPVAVGVEDYTREILIGVSKRELFVNDVRARRILCTTRSGEPCPETFEAESGAHIYRVDGPGAGEGGKEPYVIVPLLRLLEDVQRGRRAVLSGVSEESASWLVDCDAFTLAVDRDIPYGLVARVIHTAAYADLTRVRLATLDDTNTMTYIPVLAPRLDRSQKRTAHIVGDPWWHEESVRPTEGFAIAYLGYSASLYPDTFAALAEPTLPACFPPDIAWDKLLDDANYARNAREQIGAHIASLRGSHGVLLGLDESPPVPAGTLPAPHGVAPPPASSDMPEEGRDDGGEPAAGASPEGPAAWTLDGQDFPDTRLAGAGVPAGAIPAGPEGGEPEPPGPDALAGEAPPEDGEPEEAADAAPEVRSLRLRPFVYVTEAGYVVALKTPEGHLFQALGLEVQDTDKLYDTLGASSGWAVGVGAGVEVPYQRVVQALDVLRHRCLVFSMSGKCKRWQPVLPHAYFFLAPGNRFEPVLRPAPALPVAEKPSDDSTDSADPPVAVEE